MSAPCRHIVPLIKTRFTAFSKPLPNLTGQHESFLTALPYTNQQLIFLYSDDTYNKLPKLSLFLIFVKPNNEILLRTAILNNSDRTAVPLSS